MSVLTPRVSRLALCAAAASGLSLSTTHVQAQSYGYDYSGGGGEVTVTAAPRVERDPTTGAEYQLTVATRTVTYRDLDLNAAWGVRELRARVVAAARSACDQLDSDPMAIDDPADQPCVSTAIRRAMYQAPVRDAFRDYGRYD
jgi:UrcA family protein